jgi:hypothetical protein
MGKKKSGKLNFKGFMKRPRKEDKEKEIEVVRQSMCKHLEREVTRQEAKNHIRIYGAFRTINQVREKPAIQKRSELSDRLFRLDYTSGDDGTISNLGNWVAWWNGIKDGSIMASAGDFYNCFKEIVQTYILEDMAKAKKAQMLMGSLRSDMRGAGIIASTRLYFRVVKKRPNDLHALIRQHFNCQYVSQEKQTIVKVPNDRYFTDIITFGSDREGLEFLQGLFWTKDDINEIARNISMVSGISEDGIEVMIPGLEERKEHPHRGFYMGIDSNMLYLDASVMLDEVGFSRGFYPK